MVVAMDLRLSDTLITSWPGSLCGVRGWLSLMGPEENCPVHQLAQTDPGATVNIYAEDGRFMYPMSAELACEGHHVGMMIQRQVNSMLGAEYYQCK